MTPVEALCLQCIQSWLRIVQYKNGSCGEIDENGTPWTRCSATEVQSWIAKQFECEVSARQCQNALRSLEQSGRVIREKRWANRWTQAYSYTVQSTGQSRPIEPVTEGKSVVPPEVNLSSPSTNPTTKKSAVELEAMSGRSEPLPAPAPSKVKYRSSGLSSNLEMPHGSRSLAQIEELCRRIGSSELPVPTNDPQRYVDELRKTNK